MVSSSKEIVLCVEMGLGTRTATQTPGGWAQGIPQSSVRVSTVVRERARDHREGDSGRLCQIISGNDLRCIWDGRGATLPPVAPDPTELGRKRHHKRHRCTELCALTIRQRGAVHSGAARGVVQHIFELIPTMPLFLPEKLSSPTIVVRAPIFERLTMRRAARHSSMTYDYIQRPTHTLRRSYPETTFLVDFVMIWQCTSFRGFLFVYV